MSSGQYFLVSTQIKDNILYILKLLFTISDVECPYCNFTMLVYFVLTNYDVRPIPFLLLLLRFLTVCLFFLLLFLGEFFLIRDTGLRITEEDLGHM